MIDWNIRTGILISPVKKFQKDFKIVYSRVFFADATVREKKNTPKSEGVNRIRDKVVALHELYIITSRARLFEAGQR